MYLKIVSTVDGRTLTFETEQIEYQWIKEPEFIAGEVHYCFLEKGFSVSEFEHHVEFWLWKGTEALQVFMDIGRTAYIMNDDGKTIDRVN